jgi:hypothetical protein
VIDAQGFSQGAYGLIHPAQVPQRLADSAARR